MAYKRKRFNKKRVAKRRVMSKRRTASRTRLVSLIKRTVLKKAEPKEKVVAFEKKELLHNGFGLAGASALVILMNSGSMPTQGTGDNQRVGDQINATGYKIKMLIGQKADRPNVTFRYLVLTVPKGSSISYNDWFKNVVNNVLMDDVNTDFVKIHLSGQWRPNEAGLGNTGGDEYTFCKKLWVPYKKLIKFGPADAAVSHNDNDTYLVVMAYDAFGTLATDNIAYIQTQLSFYYRDP